MDALCIAHHFGKSIEGLLETMPPKGKAAEIDEIYGSLAPADQYVAISLLRALSAKREKQARSEVDQTKRPS